MREQIAEIVGEAVRLYHYEPGKYQGRDHYADRILALFGEPVAWGWKTRNGVAKVTLSPHTADYWEAQIVSEELAPEVVPLYALGDPE